MAPRGILQRIRESRLVHQGRNIAVDRLDLEMPSPEAEHATVFASVTIRAKMPGLSPNDKDVELILKVEEKWYRITEASVFDVDLHTSGETTVQIMGRLESLPAEAEEGV